MSLYLKADDMTSAYRELASLLLHTGRDVGPRGLMTRELTDVTIELPHPSKRFITSKARDVDMRYCVGELTFFLMRRTDLSFIRHYSTFWEKISDDGKTVNSAYGYRLFGIQELNGNTQFWYAISSLSKDRNTRKAVMTIYDRSDARESRDNPCTMFLQALIRNNKLELYSFMRSNDVWRGVPYDVAFFTLVQEMMYIALLTRYPDLELGHFFHHAVSMHAYAEHWEKLGEVANETSDERLIAPPLVERDLFSWFSLLAVEETSKRLMGKPYEWGPGAKDLIETPFQAWCINYL
jgi:thymidylate synthase